MPKQKTHSGAKKRFKLTAAGKVLRRAAMQSHNLGKKPQKKKRDFRPDKPVATTDARTIKRLLGKG